MARRLPVTLLALAVVASACGKESSAAHPRQTGPSCPSAGRHSVEGGFYRMPAGARPGRTPLLLVVIPGGRGDRTDRLGVARAGNRAGIAVLYPTSAGGGFWQLNDQEGTADVADVKDLVDRVTATGCFDEKRISITGVSNGAGFTARMGCALPDRFAAVMPVAAGYRALDPCPASARYDFLDIHGTADTVVPYNGKKPDREGSVPRYLAGVARRDGCSPKPRTTRPRRLVAHLVYRGCDDGLRVEHYRLTGTDHGWPGHKGHRLPRHNPSGFKSTPVVVAFARAARRS